MPAVKKQLEEFAIETREIAEENFIAVVELQKKIRKVKKNDKRKK